MSAAYREPQPPPEPLKPPKPRPWWGHRVLKALKWWFVDDEVPTLRGFFTIIAIGAATLMTIIALAEHENPCAEVVHATVSGKTPDGQPATIQTSWCGKYKPGREPK